MAAGDPNNQQGSEPVNPGALDQERYELLQHMDDLLEPWMVDGLGSGDISEMPVQRGWGNALEVNQKAAMVGNQGLQVTIHGRQPAHLLDATPFSESRNSVPSTLIQIRSGRVLATPCHVCRPCRHESTGAEH